MKKNKINWNELIEKFSDVFPSSWGVLNVQEKLFTVIAVPTVLVILLFLIIVSFSVKLHPFLLFIIFSIVLVIYINIVIKKYLHPLKEIYDGLINKRELNIPLDKNKHYSDEWGYLYAEIIDLIEKSEKSKKSFNEFYEFLGKLIQSLKESIIQLEESTKIQTEAIEKTSQYLDRITDVMTRIYSDVQSLSVSVGNTVFSLQVMEKNINKVAVDGQKMGESVFITTHSINQMAEAIKEVDKNIENSNKLALIATQSAAEGDSVVDQTVMAMSNIHKTMEQFSETIMKLGKRSDEIGKIIATIEHKYTNDTIRKLNMIINELEDENGVLFTVQEISYLSGSINL